MIRGHAAWPSNEPHNKRSPNDSARLSAFAIAKHTTDDEESYLRTQESVDLRHSLQPTGGTVFKRKVHSTDISSSRMSIASRRHCSTQCVSMLKVASKLMESRRTVRLAGPSSHASCKHSTRSNESCMKLRQPVTALQRTRSTCNG